MNTSSQTFSHGLFHVVGVQIRRFLLLKLLEASQVGTYYGLL